MPRRRVSKAEKLDKDFTVILITYNRMVRDIETGLKVRLYNKLRDIERGAVAIPSRILSEHWAGIVKDLEQ